MTDRRVELAIDGALATITLRRPEKLNALDQGMTMAGVLSLQSHTDLALKAELRAPGLWYCAVMPPFEGKPWRMGLVDLGSKSIDPESKVDRIEVVQPMAAKRKTTTS